MVTIQRSPRADFFPAPQQLVPDVVEDAGKSMMMMMLLLTQRQKLHPL
jgi:hypothetical protein